MPAQPQQDLRELTRDRAQVSADRSAVSNRIRKLLEGANIKLGSVASDVMGVSGRRMREAIIAGETDAEKLADSGDLEQSFIPGCEQRAWRWLTRNWA